MKPRLQATALVTGAGSPIGSVYADRLAKRGYDLILVDNDKLQIEALAQCISFDTGRHVEVVVADLCNARDVGRVEKIVRESTQITALVNGAASGGSPHLLEATTEELVQELDVNVMALARLTMAAAARFRSVSYGSIINVASVASIAPERTNGVSCGARSFVLAFTLMLHKELACSDIRVQAVLPGALATDFWDLAGVPIEDFPRSVVTSAVELVDAALRAFDEGELISVPALPDIVDCNAYDTARRALLPSSFHRTHIAGAA